MPGEIISEVQETIRKKILENINLTKTTDEMLEEQVRKEVDLYFGGKYVSIEDKAFLIDQIFSSIRGFGLLDTIINDDTVTEVMINGPEEIFIEKSGKCNCKQSTKNKSICQYNNTCAKWCKWNNMS